MRRVDGVFQLVGEAFVYGILKGDALEMHDLSRRYVTLV